MPTTIKWWPSLGRGSLGSYPYCVTSKATFFCLMITACFLAVWRRHIDAIRTSVYFKMCSKFPPNLTDSDRSILCHYLQVLSLQNPGYLIPVLHLHCPRIGFYDPYLDFTTITGPCSGIVYIYKSPYW